MEIVTLLSIVILGIFEIKNYLKVRDLEKRTEMTFIEVERSLNMLERGIKNANR